MRFWLEHCGASNPVSLKRWILFKLSHAVNWLAELLHEAAFDLEHWAVYDKPRSSTYDEDEIPF